MKETYYSRHKEEILERQKKYIENNKEKVLQQKREWQRKYRAKLREKGLLSPTKKQLEQENKQLTEEIETLKDNMGFNLCAIEHIRKGKNKLEEKIDKAIEYIKNNSLYYENYDYNEEDELELKYVYDDKVREDLLKILGDKENE